MRNARKRQNSIRNCLARNSEISELSPWPSKLSSLREKKIHRVGNPCSEYYKEKLCAISNFMSGNSREVNQEVAPMCNLEV